MMPNRLESFSWQESAQFVLATQKHVRFFHSTSQKPKFNWGDPGKNASCDGEVIAGGECWWGGGFGIV